MAFAILIRGHNYLEKDRFGYPMDAADNINNIIDNIIIPIREKYPDSKVYLSTYHSPSLRKIINSIGECELIENNPSNSTQISTYLRGLEHIDKINSTYSSIIALRFDLLFLKKFIDWGVDCDEDVVYFNWKEYRYNWNDHRRVGDAIHIIGKNCLSHFYNSLQMCTLAGRKDLHMMYYFMRTVWPYLEFIQEGYWDSNSLWNTNESDNPMYKIFNRPKLNLMPDYYGKIIQEIKAE